MNFRAPVFGAITALAVAASVIVTTTGCPPGTGAQVNAADAVAEDWTNAICTPAEGQPLGQPFVDLVCQGVLIVESTVGQLTAEGGLLASAAPRSATIRLHHVPADQAALMLARYGKK